MKLNRHLMPLLALTASLTASLSAIAASAPVEKPTPPYASPFLADSPMPMNHARGNFTALAGPRGPGRRLHADEIQWKPLGPANVWRAIYSGLYPNGKRVIWVGGYDRVTKLDADTLEVLTTYAIGGNTYFGEEEIQRDIAKLDKMNDADYVREIVKLWTVPLRSIGSVYRLLSNDNEFYLMYRTPEGALSLRVYGETDATDPASPIVLRREWKIPAEVSAAQPTGMAMTRDGNVVVATTDGTLIAFSRDLKSQSIIKLPSIDPNIETKDFFKAFVRNSITADDQGGIYVVSRDYLHRVQWIPGKFSVEEVDGAQRTQWIPGKLSLDEADGAWSVTYTEGAEKRGSGTTPGLLGWGPKEDHLVLIADGADNNNAIAYWRDKIPDDWKGLPGMDRRVAGVVPIRFGVSPDEKVVVENTPIIYGYGAFFNNTYPEQALPDQGSRAKQWLAESFSMHIPSHGARGGAMMRWDPKTRTLSEAWQTQANYVSTVCSISGATELLHCWGNRNREWTLEGVDWNTGKSAYTYILGKSQRFNPLGGAILVAPNGAIDCGCTGGLGMVRVKPKESRAKRK